ncbi:hypothetical protein EVAR_99213_1 [Eumeta japonica]|uniref:Uncharacterized protein n=1 Tax=Eumeta variegata TaxID=151549 RepID=A0A4C1YPI6_EUMVA|nr:hypothetical protein EVAR_99213_1 [Eumeta japonica]
MQVRQFRVLKSRNSRNRIRQLLCVTKEKMEKENKPNTQSFGTADRTYLVQGSPDARAADGTGRGCLVRVTLLRVRDGGPRSHYPGALFRPRRAAVSEGGGAPRTCFMALSSRDD